MNDNAPPTARREWLARQLGLDCNPLRRRTDWLEFRVIAGLFAVFLAGAPLIAIAAGSWAHAAGLGEQHAQRAWHQVTVVLLHDAPRQVAFRYWSPPPAVLAGWIRHSEPSRIGEVP